MRASRRIALLLGAVLALGGARAVAQGRNDAANCAIAAGGSVRDATLNCGLTADEVQRLVGAARENDQKALAAAQDDLRRLSRDLGVTEGAALAVLHALGQDTIPPERLTRSCSPRRDRSWSCGRAWRSRAMTGLRSRG